MRALRRSWRVCGGVLMAVALWTLFLAMPGHLQGSGEIMAAVTLLIVALSVTLARRMAFRSASARVMRVSFLYRHAGFFADLEFAALLLLGAVFLVVQSSGANSPAYPLVYGSIAFASTFLSFGSAIFMVALFCTFEVWQKQNFGGDLINVIMHCALALAAAFAHGFFLRTLAWHVRRNMANDFQNAHQSLLQNALDYRFMGIAQRKQIDDAQSRERQQEKLAIAQVLLMEQSISATSAMMKSLLSADTVALLWLDTSGEHFLIKELLSDHDNITEKNMLPLVGLPAHVLRDKLPVSVTTARRGQIPYCTSHSPVTAFAAVPVLDGSHVRGVLCASRQATGFTGHEIENLTLASRQLYQIMQSEQILVAVDRAKYEHERFFLASSKLGRALTLEQVMNTAFDAAAEIASIDAAAITLYETERNRHRVYAVRQSGPPLFDEKDLQNLEFRDNSGLVSMVVKNQHYLPATGELKDSTIPIFTKKVRVSALESLLVLPLISGESAIGTLVLAAREKNVFTKETRAMLSVIATQVAVSLHNALMYERMETMATTDGLTGLTNRRTFDERFGELLQRAGRHGHKAAVLLCDVDHFKKVNDNYGHPLGDEVLRRVAKVLADATRKIDIPARYGGEEFVVVLEATDLEGAIRLAERIRKDVAALEIPSEKGILRVTMSLGVSAFPDDAKEMDVLIERADTALYAAKQGGRNRVVAFRHKDLAKNQLAS